MELYLFDNHMTFSSASTAWPEDQPSAHPRETSEDE